MALSTRERQLAARLRRLGLHHTIIAELMERDPRVVADIIEDQAIHYSKPPLPRVELPPDVKKQIVHRLSTRTFTELTIPPNLATSPVETVNLFHRALIEQRQYLNARRDP